MSTSFLGIQVSPLSIARGGAAAFALLGLATGSTAILNPSSAATTFGFHPSSSIAESASSNPFIPIAGGRGVANALAILTCSYLGYNRAVGVLLMAGAVGGLIDGWSLIKYAKEVDEGKVEEKNMEEERVKAAKGAAIAHWVTLGIYSTIGTWLFLNAEG